MADPAVVWVACVPFWREGSTVIGDLTSYGSRTVAVPRWMGVARLGEVLPIDRLVDMPLSRQTGRIRRLTERAVADRTG